MRDTEQSIPVPPVEDEDCSSCESSSILEEEIKPTTLAVAAKGDRIIHRHLSLSFSLAL